MLDLSILSASTLHHHASILSGLETQPLHAWSNALLPHEALAKSLYALGRLSCDSLVLVLVGE